MKAKINIKTFSSENFIIVIRYPSSKKVIASYLHAWKNDDVEDWQINCSEFENLFAEVKKYISKHNLILWSY